MNILIDFVFLVVDIINMSKLKNIRHPMANIFLLGMAITFACNMVLAKDDKQDVGTVIGIDLGKFFGA